VTLAPVRPRCAACGGSAIDADYEGDRRCLQCGRPERPVVAKALRLAPRFRDDLAATIRQQRRIIDAAAAAGRRDWA